MNNCRKSDRIYFYNRALFVTLFSSIILDRTSGVKTLLSEVWISLGFLRKNMPLFDFDVVRFGKCWSLNIVFAGISFGIGAVNERIPLFGQ